MTQIELVECIRIPSLHIRKQNAGVGILQGEYYCFQRSHISTNKPPKFYENTSLSTQPLLLFTPCTENVRLQYLHFLGTPLD